MAFIRALLIASTLRAGAQAGPPADSVAIAVGSCAGETVRAVEIQVRPSSSSARARDDASRAAQSVGSRFATTRHDVVRAYLRVNVGKICDELRRSESERLLRAQPFIASATVRAIPDGPGFVRVYVDVVDEFPVVVGGGLRGGRLASATIGSQSFQGSGLSVALQGTRGFAYRNGFGLHLVQYGAFGKAFYVAADVERTPLGSAWSFEIAEPVLTALQRTAFRAGAREVSGFAGVVRPSGPDVALQSRRVSYSVGWVRRVGQLTRSHTAHFAGAALLGEATSIDTAPIIVSDTGFARATNISFGAEYPNLRAVRLAAIGGLRAVRFVTVRGFDALVAQQDVGVGVQLHVLAGPRVWPAGSLGNFFAAGDLYAGIGNSRSFAAIHVVSEARVSDDTPRWRGTVSSARLSWYGRPSYLRTRIVSISGAAIRHLDYPAQLTFRDADGGIAGYRTARAAGGMRAVARVEERRLTGWFRTRADIALAVFADAGKLWAGDAPYGQTTVVRSALGMSLLAAYPAGGKRTYRVDLGFPLNPERGGARFEVRVSAVDRTRLLWAEPYDVSRVRTGAVPSNLMKW